MILEDQIKEIIDNRALLALYQRGINDLTDSTVLAILYRMGRPHIIDNGADAHVMATQAAHAAGYFNALEDLQYFNDRFLAPLEAKMRAVGRGSALTPTWGGDQIIADRGYLTKAEIKNG